MILEILTNRTLICALFSWLISQSMKMIICGIKYHQWDWHYLWSSGNMPSSHTASAIAVTVNAGLREGFSSTVFAACAFFSCIVMYDAVGVRRATGKQGKILNEILNCPNIKITGASSGDMKEKIGHSPLEVIIGILVGIICAVMVDLITA